MKNDDDVEGWNPADDSPSADEVDLERQSLLGATYDDSSSASSSEEVYSSEDGGAGAGSERSLPLQHSIYEVNVNVGNESVRNTENAGESAYANGAYPRPRSPSNTNAEGLSHATFKNHIKERSKRPRTKRKKRRREECMASRVLAVAMIVAVLGFITIVATTYLQNEGKFVNGDDSGLSDGSTIVINPTYLENGIVKFVPQHNFTSAVNFLSYCNKVRENANKVSKLILEKRWSRTSDQFSKPTKASVHRDSSSPSGSGTSTTWDVFATETADHSEAPIFNLFQLLNAHSTQLGNALGTANLLINVHPDRLVRESASECRRSLILLSTSLKQNQEIYRIIDDTVAGAREDGTLYSMPYIARLANLTLTEAVQAGVNHNESQRTKIRAKTDEIIQIAEEFQENIVAARRTMEIFPDETLALQGLPQDFIDSRRQKNGSVIVSTDDIDYVPFIRSCHSRSHRKKLYKLYRSRAFPHNSAVLRKLIQRRQELARLLGYASYTDLSLEDTMARSTDRVAQFLVSLDEAVGPQAAEEMDMLSAFSRNSSEGVQKSTEVDSRSSRPGDSNGNERRLEKAGRSIESANERSRRASAILLQPNFEESDLSYLINKYRAETIGFDESELRSFFSYETVRDGLFKIAEDYWGIRLVRADTVFNSSGARSAVKDASSILKNNLAHVWHPQVDKYWVYSTGGGKNQSQSGDMEEEENASTKNNDNKGVGDTNTLSNTNPIGVLYMDMFPRADKFNHAAHFSLEKGIENLQLPTSALVCNFPRQGPMEHDHVITFFHEFGHFLHFLFSGQSLPYHRLSGLSEEDDFVEVPSTLMEKFAWDWSKLKLFARRKRGSEVEMLPKSLLDKAVEANKFGRAMRMKTQIMYSALSLFLYMGDYEQQDNSNILSNVSVYLNANNSTTEMQSPSAPKKLHDPDRNSRSNAKNGILAEETSDTNEQTVGQAHDQMASSRGSEREHAPLSNDTSTLTNSRERNETQENEKAEKDEKEEKGEERNEEDIEEREDEGRAIAQSQTSNRDSSNSTRETGKGGRRDRSLYSVMKKPASLQDEGESEEEVKKNASFQNLVDSIKKKFGLFPVNDDSHMESSFGHLATMGNTYYAYLWSRTIAEDLFVKLGDAGAHDSRPYQEYITKILQPGSSKSADILIESFLGRPFNNEAFMRWIASNEDGE